MPNTYFILFELIIYIQLALCLRHAWKNGTAKLLVLSAGILFGVLLELATIRQLNAYEYGRFLIMVLDVPLCIGVAWGCILYSVMEFSNASSLPYWTRTLLDGLLALNIDLALDAVAVRFGFWDWGQGLEFQYFGVPYANFWAWFWVIFFFSLGYRILARRKDWVGTWLSPLSGLVIGLFGVLGTNALITFVIPWSIHGWTVSLTIATALVIVLTLRPKFSTNPTPSLVFWVPFLTHSYILVVGLISGFILQPPFLLFVGLVMIGFSFYLHHPIIQNILASTKG